MKVGVWEPGAPGDIPGPAKGQAASKGLLQERVAAGALRPKGNVLGGG